MTNICTFSSFLTWIFKCSETKHKYIIKQNQSPQPENSKITEKLSRDLSPVRIAAEKRMQACLVRPFEWTSLNFQRGYRFPTFRLNVIDVYYRVLNRIKLLVTLCLKSHLTLNNDLHALSHSAALRITQKNTLY